MGEAELEKLLTKFQSSCFFKNNQIIRALRDDGKKKSDNVSNKNSSPSPSKV